MTMIGDSLRGLVDKAERSSHLMRHCRSQILEPVILLIHLVYLVGHEKQIEIHAQACQINDAGRHELVRDLLALNVEHFAVIVCKSENILLSCTTYFII